MKYLAGKRFSHADGIKPIPSLQTQTDGVNSVVLAVG